MAEKDSEKDNENMTPEQRIAYLRERGVMVETPEDRRRKEINDIMNEPDEIDGEDYEDLKFVMVPHDDSLPLKEVSVKVPKNRQANPSGDLMLVELKPWFRALSKKVDMGLFQDQATKHFGSSENPGQVSQEALMKVADQGQVESFTLVQPRESNRHTMVNIYLDEVGMLKRLPLNKRAAQFCGKAGFNPPPKFYGDVFLGRMKVKPVLKNIDFKLTIDTAPDAAWLQAATMENLEHQTAMNQITGRNDTQPVGDGENGVAKAEDGYTWTQNDEEIEIVISLKSEDGSSITSTKETKGGGGLKVKFFAKKMNVEFRKKDILSLSFYASVDPDGCTWTLDSDANGVNLVVTCEKNDGVSWPRVTV